MIKLLHVEDDADIREIVRLSLELSGAFEVVQCDSGPEALRRVERFAPDVFLLDMMMPGMTGKQTLQHMRQIPALADTPAIFMTARAQAAELDALHGMGAADVISKPFDPMALSDQVMAVIR